MLLASSGMFRDVVIVVLNSKRAAQLFHFASISPSLSKAIQFEKKKKGDFFFSYSQEGKG